MARFQYPLSALSVIYIVGVTFFQGFCVGSARATYKIVPPKCVGNVEFEKLFRAHQNTLEQYALFIPTFLLLILTSQNDKLAGIIGFLWGSARLLYHFGYNSKRVENRMFGVVITSLTTLSCMIYVAYQCIRLLM